MSDNKTSSTGASELKTTGVLSEKGVRVTEKSSVDALSQRGYGSSEDEVFMLAFYEALYLSDKEMLEVRDENGAELDFKSLLQCYEKANENAWVNYLVTDRRLNKRPATLPKPKEGAGFGCDESQRRNRLLLSFEFAFLSLHFCVIAVSCVFF
jgi:tRNA splicing endonuclease